jgi:hypothetical protein
MMNGLNNVLVVLPDSARQGLRYEINNLYSDDPEIYVNDWQGVKEAIKKVFPKARSVNVMTNVGSISKAEI